jgi:hypothetical protein
MPHCRITAGLALLLLLLAPSTSAAAEPYAQNFQLGVGESTEVGDEGLMVGFAEVLMDTRCPSSVVCVWEGDAEVSVWVEPAGGERVYGVLHTTTTGGGNLWIEVANHMIWLVNLAPYPVLPGAVDIDPNEYIATLSVDRLESVEGERSSWGMMKGRYR